MKTLKLTDAEWVTLKEVYLFHPIFPNKDGLLDVDDVDKFREFLLESITDLVGDFSNDQNLKSIIMKLDNKVSSSRNELVRSISRKINASDRAEQQNVAYERKNKKNIVIGIIK